MKSPKPLSVVLITLNAAHQLEPCLQSAAFAEEIIVVDSGSTDGTVELAKRYGARVIDQQWLGFGLQKQFAVRQAKYDWVLCLDADERVTPELQKSVEKVLQDPQHGAYQLARCNKFMGRYLKHGEGYPDWNLRLFRRDAARWSDDVVHEHVITDASPARLDGDLLHDTAETLEAYLTKQNRYTSLAAEAAFKEGKSAAATRVLLSPIFRFFKFYILRRGFLDGLPGLTHILIGCFNSAMKYAKIIDLQRSQGDKR